MLVTMENGRAISGSEILECVFRSSLEPVPVSFEMTVKLSPDFASEILEGKILKVGEYQTPVKIILATDRVASFNQDNGVIQFRKVIALHENSAAIAENLPKAVIRENVTLSEVYRSCGGKSDVQKDFSVPKFYGFQGQVPSLQLTRICQEHGGVIRWIPRSNGLSFFRINDLFNQEPTKIQPKFSDDTIKSDFLVKHEVPQFISTDEHGAFIRTQNQMARNVRYVPNKNQAQLNAMVNVILNAKELPCDYSPKVHAGEIVQIGNTKMAILTAAHYIGQNSSGAPRNHSVFWLGVKM